MHYRTITHELLTARPHLASRLARDRLLLPTLTRLAEALRERHFQWQTVLPDRPPLTARSEALELAVADLTRALDLLSPTADGEWEPTLDQAVASLRSATPPE